MKISNLNARIELQISNSNRDEIGNWKEEWETAYSCFAFVDSRGQSGGEVSVAGLIVDHSDLIFTIRYTPKLKDITTNTHRILFQNDYYDIKRVDFMNFKNKTLKLYAKRVER
ncbi:phage head closure protein [Facklamia lactis]|uniref:phage head closure protein n=1 Tax=Facklamia lactis TaxID=2749967 RepID=UPI0018CE9CB0|nr:phage head closure protein [Facklamia lactis]MBG9980446.1 phage head closure protein [Facklamia lactis]